MKKKILATVLSAAMLLGMAPASMAGTKAPLSEEAYVDQALTDILLVNQDTPKKLRDALSLKAGDFLFTDTFNNVIWVYDGEETRIAAGRTNVEDVNGEPLEKYEDGTLDTASFMEPWAICRYRDGYAVSDRKANVIRYIDDKGVHTLAGTGKAGKSNGYAGLMDGYNNGASFSGPTGLAVGSKDELYIADTDNGLIRKLSKDGYVNTYVSGLNDPMGLFWYDGALYVAENGANRILKVVNGKCETVAGSDDVSATEYNEGGFLNGSLDKATLDHPQDLFIDTDGTIYISDTGNSAVRKIQDGIMSVVQASYSGTGMPIEPEGLIVNDGLLYINDSFAHNTLILDLNKELKYDDVLEDDWFSDAVSYCTRIGLIIGTEKGKFSPYDEVTRGMFAMLLVRFEKHRDGNTLLNKGTSFDDVSEDSWYNAGVKWAAENGISNGSQSGDRLVFNPEDKVTRQDMIVLLYRYAKLNGAGLISESEEDLLADFNDKDEVSEYAIEAMNWAIENGLISGVGENTLDPKGYGNRAQTAQLLTRFSELLEL